MFVSFSLVSPSFCIWLRFHNSERWILESLKFSIISYSPVSLFLPGKLLLLNFEFYYDLWSTPYLNIHDIMSHIIRIWYSSNTCSITTSHSLCVEHLKTSNSRLIFIRQTYPILKNFETYLDNYFNENWDILLRDYFIEYLNINLKPQCYSTYVAALFILWVYDVLFVIFVA